MTTLLEVENLVKHFVAGRSVFGRPTAFIKAVDGVSFSVDAGQTLALVGESGCGKSTVSRLVLRLIEPDSGHIRFEGRDLLALGANELRAFRRDAQIIFQDPYASLNPRMTVSQLLTEPLALHDLVPPSSRRDRVEELLRLVGLEPRFARRYPHEFSGGQRQRIGVIVETADTQALFASPRHPYSRALLSAIPVPKPRAKRSRILLQGEMPSALNPPAGCRFHTRCPHVIERCRVEPPELLADSAGHMTACHRTAQLPPPDAIVPADGAFSPALERLIAAFSGPAEVPASSGVDMVGATPPEVV